MTNENVEESVDVELATLGVVPYVLLEAEPDEDSEAGFGINLKAGGGIQSTEAVIVLMLMVLENITGVRPDLYVSQIDEARRAAGLEPITEQDSDDAE